MDATIIAASGSSKEQGRKRDPEVHQAKNGNQWHLRMKMHIGVDEEFGLVHHVECTAANVASGAQVHQLLHGTRTRRQRLHRCGQARGSASVDAAFWVAEKPSKLRATKNTRERRAIQRWAPISRPACEQLEHRFRVVKRQFGYTKTRYRGLAKNSTWVLTLFVLSNLWMARRHLLQTPG